LEKWAKYKNIAYTDHEQLIKLPEVREKMEREVLGPLSDLAQYERPKKVLLLPHEFTIDRGTLTPSLKIKRRAVDEMFKEEIDALYAEAENHHPNPSRAR
jgi:long-chain acyl-CoA synthetase